MIGDTLKKKGWIVLREHHIPITRNRQVKPDLIVIHPTRPLAFVFDVRISYELNKDSLAKQDLGKRAKYSSYDQHILDYIRINYPDITKLEYFGLIFGSRGSFHCVTLNLLKDTFKFSDLRLGAIIDKIIDESLMIYSLFHGSSTSQPSDSSSAL